MRTQRVGEVLNKNFHEVFTTECNFKKLQGPKKKKLDAGNQDKQKRDKGIQREIG